MSTVDYDIKEELECSSCGYKGKGWNGMTEYSAHVRIREYEICPRCFCDRKTEEKMMVFNIDDLVKEGKLEIVQLDTGENYEHGKQS